MNSSTSPRFSTLFAVGSVIAMAILCAHWTSYVALPQCNEEARLYTTHTRDDLRQLFLHAIDTAEESIFLIIYALQDELILKALQRKAEEGCLVDVVYDVKASGRPAKQLGPEIDATGVRGSGLMHHKLLVIDRELVVASSANLTSDSMRHHGNLAFSVRNSLIANTIISNGQWIRGDPVTPIPELTCYIAGQTLELHFLPCSDRAEERITQLMDHAQQSLTVAMYTFTNSKLCDALCRASHRGVDVAVVIDRSTARGASRGIAKQLAQDEVPVALSDTPPLLHYKMALIDETWLIAGSANWTEAAFRRNHDYLLILSPLTSQQAAVARRCWSALWKESVDY